MLESFVIMLREGVEIALVIGIIMVVLNRSNRRDLARPVWVGVGLAAVASIVAAVILNALPINEETYEGALYTVAAAFVISMMVWMHRKSKTIHADIQARVQRAMDATAGKKARREGWGLAAFAFVMVFREGAETVMFLSAVNLTTDAMLSFLGTLAGLIAAIAFGVLFVRGSRAVNLPRFFKVTEWVLGIFVAQLIINGYHELSEAEIVYASPATMAFTGPIVRNNSLFILAMVAIPMFIWLTKQPASMRSAEAISDAQRRLEMAKARRERFYRYAAVASALIILSAVGILYARERTPQELSTPEPLTVEADGAVIPAQALDDGVLHRYLADTGDGSVRLIAIKGPDGRYRVALDACPICGTYGYVQSDNQLLCINCVAEINPVTVGIPGGCNPIPIETEVTPSGIRVSASALDAATPIFADGK